MKKIPILLVLATCALAIVAKEKSSEGRIVMADPASPYRVTTSCLSPTTPGYKENIPIIGNNNKNKKAIISSAPKPAATAKVKVALKKVASTVTAKVKAAPKGSATIKESTTKKAVTTSRKSTSTNFGLGAVISITATAASTVNAAVQADCTPASVCVDAINSCYMRYGGCYDTCSGPFTALFTPPPCPTKKSAKSFKSVVAASTDGVVAARAASGRGLIGGITTFAIISDGVTTAAWGRRRRSS